MKRIPIINKEHERIATAMVDDADFERVSSKSWWLTKNGYATNRIRLKYGVYRNLLMHRFILGLVTGDKIVTDHKDRNKLNNQRTNIRKCSYSENSANKIKSVNKKSGYKGVRWRPRQRKWEASMECRGKYIYLGLFDKAKAASKAYLQGSRKYFGEFARP